MKVKHSALLALCVSILGVCEGPQRRGQGHCNPELGGTETQRRHAHGLQAETMFITSFSEGQIGTQTRPRSCDHKYNIPVVLVRGLPIAGGPRIRGKQYPGRWWVGNTVM